MRATRNASKGTPPSVKKTGKGTPGKGTPKTPVAEKKDDTVKAEADTVVASDVELVIPLESSSQADVKPDDAAAEMIEAAKDVEGSKSKPSVTKKKSGTPKKKTDETPEKEVVPSETKPEIVKEASLEKEPGKADENAVPVDTLPMGADIILGKASEPVEEEEEKVTQSGGADEEMQEGDEDQVEDAGTDDAKDEQDDEEDEDGEDEDDEEEEDEGDLVDEGPVTERQKRKKLEVFVGGLDKDATADEVKQTFEVVGEVVGLRLATHPQSGKNRGYAFVRFATVQQATRAVSELDKIKIREKECAVVPSEDNHTLFVGNLCKSWNSTQILEKMKEYGVEGIDDMLLPDDQEHEGHNRGHAFLKFVTYNDSLEGLKRLSKPDAIFGCDRSARVAWADGLSEPDERIMAKVKSVFVDGIPEEWDDQELKEHFDTHGDIERIVLAKNIPKSKRRDFAFVNFATREAAVAAIEALNDVELADGDKKVKLKVELAKPAPRRKRIRWHRGSYPVGGSPSSQKNVEGTAPGGAQNERRRSMSRGGRGGRGSSQWNASTGKQKGAEERPMQEERPRDKPRRGPKFPRAGAAVSRGNRSARQGGSGAHSDEDYLPMGARMNPGQPSRAVRPRRHDRDYAYSRPGSKRLYSVMDEEAAYYEAAQRGYPRARLEYADPALSGASLYSNSLRSAPLGHGSLSHVLPAVRGSHGYAPPLPGVADYNGYGPAAVDPRGASYPPTYYGSRTGTRYPMPSGSGTYY